MRPAQILILTTLTVLPLSSTGCDPMAAEITERDSTLPLPRSPDDFFLEIDPGRPEVCGHTTATQTGWGGACGDSKSGCVRDEHFMGVFPEGLIVGCGVLTANLVTSAAVEHALPSFGAPRALTEKEACAYDGDDDPVAGTALFGQVVALTLNVGMDDITATDGVPLEALVIGDPNSPCEGMSVGEVLEQANYALGGCPATHSPAKINVCALEINAAFADGSSCSALFRQPETPPQ